MSEGARYLLLAWIGVLAMIALMFITFFIKPSHARDAGQWEGSDPKIKEWYQTLMSPDIPNMPCCGESDAYWCDDYYARGDKAFCRITDDRPDEPLKRPHIAVGTEVEIPANKLKHDAGNPTGHSILFVSRGMFTYCYVQAGGV